MSPPEAWSRQADPLPAVDDHVIASECGFEIIDGKLIEVLPADEAHGSRRSKIAALLELHVGEAYDVAVDMLTRTSKIDDFAPDASVFPRARDPETGGRRLEELAFEVLDTQTLANAGKKARKLCERGVRRVLAVDLDSRRVLEWDRPTDTWRMLDPDGVITDRTLAAPLPVAALVSADKADDAAAHALLRKRNPVLEQALQEREKRGFLQGLLQGKAEALLLVLRGRDLVVTEQQEALIRAASADEIEGWLARAAKCCSVSELVGRD